jgi:hypothetical protein
MLMEILHDAVGVLMFVNGACLLLALAAGGRHQTLMVWDWMGEPGWRWWADGNVFSSSLPERFRVRRRQLMTLIFVFFATLAIQVLLVWLHSMTAKAATAC